MYSFSEYTACKIAKKLGYKVQEVNLGHYKGKECVACKLLDSIPTTFEGLGDSTLEGNKFEYNLDWLLGLDINNKFSIFKKDYIEYVWDVFVLDMIISNFDRHENNWGFMRVDGKYEPAPLYDLGASLYPKLIYKDTRKLSDNEIKNIIEYQTRCAILYRGKKKNYMELLYIYRSSKELRRSLISILNKKKDFSETYNTIVRYNKNYQNHMIFIDRMLSIKYNLLRSWLKSV